MALDRPIILIGAQRSGTTWMGKVLERHPRVAYWEEPRHVWTWGSGYHPDDVLTEADATPRIAGHIRAAFERFTQRQGADRFAEKTPSNCLRIPFIRAVFPDARIVLLVRDGRSVLRSTAEIMGRGVSAQRVWQRAIETPIWEWPAYAPRAAKTLTRRITRKPLDFWGPRPPGWRDWVGADPQPVVLAKQWAGAISRALDDAEGAPEEQVLRMRYEALMHHPREQMERLIDFLELSDAAELVEHVVATVDPTRAEKWRTQLDADLLELVRPHTAPLLERLGYAW
jgi:hypothetical protein